MLPIILSQPPTPYLQETKTTFFGSDRYDMLESRSMLLEVVGSSGMPANA